MEFDEDLEQFIFEFNGLIFAWDEEPGENYLEQVKTLSEKYNAHLNFIVEFMMPYITKVFGTFSFDEIKEKLSVKLECPIISLEDILYRL